MTALPFRGYTREISGTSRRFSGGTGMRKGLFLAALAATAAVVAISGARSAAPRDARPWMNRTLSPDRRADLALGRMTRDEKLTLVFGYFATDFPSRHF